VPYTDRFKECSLINFRLSVDTQSLQPGEDYKAGRELKKQNEQSVNAISRADEIILAGFIYKKIKAIQ
jgi:hypothetical protein